MVVLGQSKVVHKFKIQPTEIGLSAIPRLESSWTRSKMVVRSKASRKKSNARVGTSCPPILLNQLEGKVSNNQLERLSWAVFIIMAGCFWIVGDVLPKGSWSVGIGVIFILLNMSRYVNKISTSELTIALGTVLIISGLVEYTGALSPVLPIAVIALGLIIAIVTLRRHSSRNHTN